MLEGFYSIASGVLMQERAMNVISNNMANLKTPGFRAERLLSSTFEDELVRRIERNNTAGIGKATPLRVTKEVSTDFGESLMEETNRPFDVGLKGTGFFNIRREIEPTDANDPNATTDSQERFLTRNGNFDLDDEGFLILRDVGRVQGENGDIPLSSSYFTIAEDGTISDLQGKRIDKLLITNPTAEVVPSKYNNGLYIVPDFEENQPATDIRVFQGTLERSNIDLNREMSIAIETQRMFNACSAALRTIDGLNQKSVAQIASIT